MTEVNLNGINKITTEEPKKSKKPIFMNKPPQLTQENKNNDHHKFDKQVPNELRGGLKTLALLGLSFPVPQTKRQRMMHNLQNSKYTTEYLDKYLCIDNVATLDDHTKFALVYGMNILDCFMFGEDAEQDEKEQIQKKDAPPVNDSNVA